MKKIVVKLVFFIAFIAASVIGGWFLWQVPDLIPCGNITDIWPCSDMPYPVDMFIRFCLSITGHDDLANPDDMEVLSALLYWLIATLLVGLLIYLGKRVLQRYLAKRKSRR